MKAVEWLIRASDALRKKGNESPRLEAEVLLAHALNRPRESLLTHPETEFQELTADALLSRRLISEPLAYVIGRKEFYGRDFIVNRSVMIPRPETEVLVEAVASRLKEGMRCVDVGTGSGVIAVTLALEKPRLHWAATDISSTALETARINAGRLGACVRFLQCDALSCFRSCSLDAVVSNPPYVEPDDPCLDEHVRAWEPPEALFAQGGTSFINRLVSVSERVLKPGGFLAFEFGIRQDEDVRRALQKNYEFEIFPDLARIPRIAIARLI